VRILSGLIIPTVVTYIPINGMVCKWSAIIWHFTALSLGWTEYYFVSSDEWSFAET